MPYINHIIPCIIYFNSHFLSQFIFAELSRNNKGAGYQPIASHTCYKLSNYQDWDRLNPTAINNYYILRELHSTETITKH